MTLNLTITNSNTGTDVITACDSYTWIDGVTYTSSNSTATHTLTNQDNCDSVVTLNLTITNSNTGTDVITACDSYTWIDGVTYTSSNSTATHTLTNQEGCDSVVTLNLTIYTSTLVDAGPPEIICAGETIILNATGGTNFVWSVSGQNGDTISPSSTGYLHVTGTDMNGCSSSDSLSVTVNSLPIVLAGSDQSVCPGTSVTLTASGAHTYAWDNGVINLVSFTPAATNTYTVTGTDVNGCSNVDSVVVTIFDVEDIQLPGYGLICDNDPSIDLAAGLSGYTFSGSNVSNNVLNVVTAGSGASMIYVTTTDNNGCIAMDSTYLIIESSPAQPEIVRTSALVIQTTQAFDAYQWYFKGQIMNGQKSRSVFTGLGGNYKVKVTNVAGCTNESDPFFVGYVGLDELGSSKIGIFPNPASESLNIDLRGIMDPMNLEIIDGVGRVLNNQPLTSNELNAIDIAYFKSGTYIVRLVSEAGDAVYMNLKIVK